LYKAFVCLAVPRFWLNTWKAIGRSQLQAQWPGTLSRILSGIHRAAQTVLGIYLKRTCSCITSASNTLGVLNDYALYKSMQSLTQCYTVCIADRMQSVGLSGVSIYTCTHSAYFSFSSSLDRKITQHNNCSNTVPTSQYLGIYEKYTIYCQI